MNFIRLIYLAFIALISPIFEQGASFGIETFLIPSILMGAGVAIDVTLATLAKFQDDSLSWRNWTLPVTLTHTLFPALAGPLQRASQLTANTATKVRASDAEKPR